MYSVVTVGAAYSANKGAASMLQALVDRLPEAVGPVKVTAVSTHARDDRLALRRAGTEVRVVSQHPIELAVVHFPLALVAAALRTVHLPWRWVCRPPAMRALAKADVVADISGISFVDGRRRAVLVYNALLVLVPLLLGRKVVKCAQAMGPARTPLSRPLAHLLLPQLHAICPRGTSTEKYLLELGLSNLIPANDLAFVMDVPDDVRSRMQARLDAEAGGGPYLVVSPSQVVATSCEDIGVPYEQIVADLLDAIADKAEATPVLVADSAQADASANHMNDLPLCRSIHRRLRRPDGVIFLDEDLLPTELRAVIGAADLLVTSRFHAMVSALCERTPSLVIGWSHKYAEILDPFGLGDVAMTFDDLTDEDVVDRALGVLDRRDEIETRIAEHLPAARAEAEVNLTVLAEALGADAVTVVPVPAPVRANKATVTQDLSGVLEASMCIGCGVCQFADPSVEVRLDPTKLIYEPSHASNETAASVCPAVAVDFEGLQEWRFPGAEQTTFGVVHSVLLAQSTNRDRNLKASSGGLVKELLLHYLDQPDVDGVLALGHVGGIEFETRLVTEAAGVDELPGSIYHNLAEPKALELLHELEGRYVLVAIPCQLEGIFSYIRNLAPELAEKVHTTIGLLCGWQYSHHSLRAIADFKKISLDDVTDISYRGEGPVGRLRMWTGEQVHTVGRRVDFDYQVAFDRSFNTPRCHVCVNHSNYLADIVVGDAWLPSTVASTTGVSLLVCRTAGTDEAVRALDKNDRVKVVEVSTAEVMESQKRRVVFGDFAYAYADYLDEIGVHHPDMVAPSRPAAELTDRTDVARFHKELTKKLALQRAGRYRYLRVRKATVELPRHVAKYLDWFLVRVLRIKSITGRRKEVPRAQLKEFL